MDNLPQLWIVLRVVVVLIASWGIASFNASESNLNWLSCLLISIAGGTFLFLWLVSIGSRLSIDWTTPLSFTQPFFPMNRYPIRYWIVVAVSLILGGGFALLKEVLRSGHHAAFGATFIFLGIAILLAIGAWMKTRLT